MGDPTGCFPWPATTPYRHKPDESIRTEAYEPTPLRVRDHAGLERTRNRKA